jgi:S-(hydroxymethyl)glutathione dehydrogenase/alcohol dehydrogenase
MHYMGISIFANFTMPAEIAQAKIREDVPFDKVCYIGYYILPRIGGLAIFTSL